MRLTYLLGASLLAIVMLSVAPQARATHNSAAPILTWNEQALEVVRLERMGAFGAARLYAMVNVGMYDAVNGIDVARRRSDRDFALVAPAGAPRFASRRAAAVTAAHAVLSALAPDRAGELDAQRDADLEVLGIHGYFRRFVLRGARWGEAVGQRVVELRAQDGASPSETQPGSNNPGEFRADWGSSQFRNLAPFGVESLEPYRSSGPPALDSAAYAEAWNEVRLEGDGSDADPLKSEIVNFWKGGGGSSRPPGEWIKIALVVAPQQPRTRFSLSQRARLFALLGISLSDSAATSADSKFTYHFWRPTSAIREADIDGNPETASDPSWNPRNGSIGGSPEHTSGQSTFAGAGSTTLARFYCRDAVSFTFTGDNATVGPRSFSSFSAAAQEAGRARIFAGIHFEFSNQAGQGTGRTLAAEVIATQLLRGYGPTHHGLCPR